MKIHPFFEKVESTLTRFSPYRRTRIPRRIEDTPQPPSRIPRMLSFVVPVLVLASAWFTTPVYSGNADLWREQSIYQVITDRFAVGGGKTRPCNVTASNYCGGNWQGIIDKLDYIQDMGFTAIWISPIVKNVPPSVTYGSGEAYHGYWAEDLYSVNPYFGNGSDLLALSHALHARKMLLMVDVAPNHMGSGAADATKYNNYIPWADEHYFHPPNFNITYSPPNQTEIETFWIGGPDGVSLPDVNTELPEVYNTLYLWIRQLVETYAVDGLRLDTVKHIRKSFWQQFCKSSGVFAIGEVLDGGFDYVGPYQNFIPGLLDYVTYFPTLRALTATGQMSQLYNNLIELPQKFVDVTLLGRFIENHDQPRFAGLTNDTGLRQSAFVFNILSDAIPIVYYGQEIFLSGGNDPQNREALWDHGYGSNNLIKTLNKVRQLAISKDPKFITTQSKYLYNDDYQLYYQKGSLLVGLNGQGAQRKVAPYDQTIHGTTYTAGEVLIEVISCASINAGSGQITVNIKGGAPIALYPKTSLVGSGICGL